MKDISTKSFLIILTLVVALKSLHINSHKTLSMNHQFIHMSSSFKHSQSSTFKTYSNSLLNINKGITLNPPSVSPTPSLTLVNLTIADCRNLNATEIN